MVTQRVAFRRPDRRTFLTAAGMMLAAGFPLQAAPAGPRLAAIDWAMLETAIAIGHMPVAACELIRFRQDVIEPAIPAEVVDLGLRGAPNFELLQLVRPDLILISPYYTRYEDRLRRLAPVLNLPFFDQGEPPLPKAKAALIDLAEEIGDPAAGQRAAAKADLELNDLAKKLGAHDDRPFCLINIGDARHMRVFGFDSLFGSTLDRLGLENAWGQGTEFSFLAPVPIETLADMPEARVVVIGQVPPEAQRGLSRNVLWRKLPAVAQGRLYQLPEINAYGAMPSALRFGQLLSQALSKGPVAQL